LHACDAQLSYNFVVKSTNEVTVLKEEFIFLCNMQNVSPDPHSSCGPYSPSVRGRNLPSFYEPAFEPVDSSIYDGDMEKHRLKKKRNIDKSMNHDTIGLVAIDRYNKIAAGTSTNGAKFKIPGYVFCLNLRMCKLLNM